MNDRTTLPPAPDAGDPLVITPAVRVPADLPARIADALTCLTAIEPVVAAVAERIGTEAMPTAHWVWEVSGAPAAVAEEFDDRTGWRDLSNALHRLAMSLLCAAGEPDQPPDAPPPDWYSRSGPREP